ncbi:MAG: carboxymuconolactone decarboxylase family protein [Actinomycetota bacterium]|nr:carboxymuconolactone decarboxylase family protein [Actinomycetota bacterium]
MARIEPIAWEDLPAESRVMLEAGSATGMYTITSPMQIMAYSTAALTAMHRQYEATFRKGVLEPRLVELLRLHSAQAGACEPCSASRKDDSISEDDVACLLDPSSDRFTPREAAAIRFFDLLNTNHHAIDDHTFRSLAEVFTTAEIVEMAYLCSTFLGGHRLMHTLGVFGTAEPVLAYQPGDIDRSGADAVAPAAVAPAAVALALE